MRSIAAYLLFSQLKRLSSCSCTNSSTWLTFVDDINSLHKVHTCSQPIHNTLPSWCHIRKGGKCIYKLQNETIQWSQQATLIVNPPNACTLVCSCSQHYTNLYQTLNHCINKVGCCEQLRTKCTSIGGLTIMVAHNMRNWIKSKWWFEQGLLLQWLPHHVAVSVLEVKVWVVGDLYRCHLKSVI